MLCECMVQLQSENDILIDGAPFKQMVSLQHVADRNPVIVTAVREASALEEQGSLFRGKQSGDNGEQGRFAASVYLETFWSC